MDLDDFTLYEEISKIIKKAKEDPQFLHSLFFDTEKAISELDVDRRIKGRLLSISPENALAALIGALGGIGGHREICRRTCGGETCYRTCGKTSYLTYGGETYFQNTNPGF